jgi:hypothetical protein
MKGRRRKALEGEMDTRCCEERAVLTETGMKMAIE